MNHIMYSISKDILAAKEKGLDGFELLLYQFIKQDPKGISTNEVKRFLSSTKFTSDVIFKGLSNLLVRDLIYKEGDLWKVL